MRLQFYRRLFRHGGPDEFLTLGEAVQDERGRWRFEPAPGQTLVKPRKWHDTWEACLPKWVRYPDGCESKRV